MSINLSLPYKQALNTSKRILMSLGLLAYNISGIMLIAAALPTNPAPSHTTRRYIGLGFLLACNTLKYKQRLTNYIIKSCVQVLGTFSDK